MCVPQVPPADLRPLRAPELWGSGPSPAGRVPHRPRARPPAGSPYPGPAPRGPAPLGLQREAGPPGGLGPEEGGAAEVGGYHAQLMEGGRATTFSQTLGSNCTWWTVLK